MISNFYRETDKRNLGPMLVKFVNIIFSTTENTYVEIKFSFFF